MKDYVIKNSDMYITPYGNVYINKKTESTGIRLSGGLDSAVVLYMIASTFNKYSIKTPIYPITVRRINTTEFTEYDRVNIYPYVDTIIDYIRSKFPNVVIKDSKKLDADLWWPTEHKDGKNIGNYTFAQTTLSNYQTWRFTRPYIFKEKNPQLGEDILYCEYTGTTMNPSEDSGVPQSEESHRDKKTNDYIENTASAIYVDDFIAYIEPFRNADKRITIWLAKHLGILEDLLPITRSCEGGPVETEEFTKECMKCWWCLERHWALDAVK